MNQTENRLIRLFALKSIAAASGQPMPENALRVAVDLGYSYLGLTQGDLDDVIRKCEEDGWIIGTNDDAIGTVWLLTPKGELTLRKARL